MKIRIWGLVAFNVTAMYVIFQAASPKLTTTLLIILFSTDLLLGMVFRHFPLPRASSTGDAMSVLGRSSWDCYIPVLGGMIGILVGVFELSWKLCLAGIIAIAIGFARIWARGHTQQAVRR